MRNWTVSTVRCFSSKLFRRKPASSRSLESPTSVVFLNGEGLNMNIWNNTEKLFNDEGHETFTVDILSSKEKEYNIDAAVATLNNLLGNNDVVMPVIVAHSISTFIVQKYIESFSVAGLVLINPVPPVSYDNVTKMLLHHWTKSITDNSLSSVEYLMNYYNIKITDNCSVNEFSGHQYQHLISDGSKALPVHPKLLTDLLGTDRVDVLVEKGSVPISLFFTEGDRIILGDEVREEVNSYYDINVDDNHFYNEHSRLPMLSKAYSDQFHSDLLSEVDSMSR